MPLPRQQHERPTEGSGNIRKRQSTHCYRTERRVSSWIPWLHFVARGWWDRLAPTSSSNTHVALVPTALIRRDAHRKEALVGRLEEYSEVLAHVVVVDGQTHGVEQDGHHHEHVKVGVVDDALRE